MKDPEFEGTVISKFIQYGHYVACLGPLTQCRSALRTCAVIILCTLVTHAIVNINYAHANRHIHFPL